MDIKDPEIDHSLRSWWSRVVLPTPRVHRVGAGSTVVLVALAAALSAQQSQTLPAGFLNTHPGTSTGSPFNHTSSQIWHWHYDSAQFSASGPIVISEVSVRAGDANWGVNAFDFPVFAVTLIEASTDYVVGAHDPVFANNICRSKVVRSGPWTGGPIPPSGGTAATWIPFGLTDSFVYDPTTGNDLIIEVTKCSTNATWGVEMDARNDSNPGQNGGNMYGQSTGSCQATTSTTNLNEWVPVVKIDYVVAPIGSPCTALQSGPGLVPGTTVPLDPLTGTNRHLGVVEANGRVFVSASGPLNSSLHLIYELDCSGSLVATHQQQQFLGSYWGHRDGATDVDSGGTFVFFGDEYGTHCYDISPCGSIQPVMGTTCSMMADNGPQCAVFPIPPIYSQVSRGLAYNPSGNSGEGSFWTADFGSSLVEFDTSGTILTIHPNTQGWSIYGLAHDPTTGNLWASSAPDAGPIVEIDLTSAPGTLTGRTIERAQPGSAQGGLSRVTSGSPWVSTASGFLLIGLDQEYASDSYSVYNSTPAPYPGTGEDLRLVAGINGQAATASVGLNGSPGDLVSITILTPQATFQTSPFIFAAELFPTGAPSPSFPGFPSIHLTPSGMDILIDTTGLPFPLIIGPAGVTLTASIPQSFSGQNVMLQAATVSPLATNGLFATSDALAITVQ